ncbi:SWIM-type domain-containing protein [Citrus sinensis]|nr:SWIM-type domain-containing protein [Citrus sinensis]
MEVAVFEATILPTLRPDLPLCGVLQAMLHNCGVQLSAEQITWVNDGGNEPPPRTGGTQGPPTELNENDGHEDDDVDEEYSTDGTRIDDTDDDDANDDDQNKDNGADIMDDARGSSSDDETAEVDPQLLADTSYSDYDLGTTQLEDYIEVHAYKPGRNGKHRLRARERARKDINGDHARGYEDLFQYAAVIHKYDPGAICIVLCDAVTRPEKVLFQRFFMAFPAQKNALNNGCRPYIGLDGCHLKSKYGGVILAAVGMDANNGMVPLALAVCEIENTETWSWFLEILHSYFDNGLEQITFCSDRQKGLLGAIEITWPTAYHRPCARHIYANFCKEHPGVSLRNLFWRAVSSTNKFDYAIAMEKLKKEKLEAWQWLETELTGFTWSRHEYDKNCKVKDKGYYPARRFIVDLMSRSCDCGYWDLAGIPCTHAMAAISHARHTATEYLPKYFSKEAYLNTYAVMFKPIPDKVTWDPCDRPKLFPPEITKKIGRPKKSRKRAATEPIKKKTDHFISAAPFVVG